VQKIFGPCGQGLLRKRVVLCTGREGIPKVGEDCLEERDDGGEVSGRGTWSRGR
jgi:hypothetical protein